MLVLSRKCNESVVIAENIVVTVIEVSILRSISLHFNAVEYKYTSLH